MKKREKNCSTIPRSDRCFFKFIYYDIVKKIKYPRAMIQCKGAVEKKERIGERREIEKKTMGSVFCWRFGRARSTPFSHTTHPTTINSFSSAHPTPRCSKEKGAACGSGKTNLLSIRNKKRVCLNS
jgi:hypothetical protein